MKFVTTEVTGFAPSSAIQFPLFDEHEILFSTLISAQILRLPRSNKPNSAKLTQNQINQIVERHHSGQSLRELAADFGVSHETIRTIIKHHQAVKSQYVSTEKPRKERADV